MSDQPRNSVRMQRPEELPPHLGERLSDTDAFIGLWVRADLKALEDWEDAAAM